MRERCLSLPLDFDRRDEVRKLARSLGEAALGLVLRLWLDWSREGLPIRPQKHDLTWLIEEAVGWKGTAGEFIANCVEAGVLLVTHEGVELCGFGRFNEHLHPSWKSIQQRGGEAKRLKGALSEVERIASSPEMLLRLDAPDLTETQRRKACALLMGMETALGRGLRGPEQYEAHLVRIASQVCEENSEVEVRRFMVAIGSDRERLATVDLDHLLRNYRVDLSSTPEPSA